MNRSFLHIFFVLNHDHSLDLMALLHVENFVAWEKEEKRALDDVHVQHWDRASCLTKLLTDLSGSFCTPVLLLISNESERIKYRRC